MATKRIAHLSDLHLGVSAAAEHAARGLAEQLLRDQPELVVVSGDITQHGYSSELTLFHRIFGDLRPVMVPGNHDRLGKGLAMMLDRVELRHYEGASVLCIDSTGPHNRSMRTPQGMLTAEDLAAIDRALDQMPSGALRVATLHHHPLWLPEDDLWEKVGGWLGITRVEHLHCGAQLLALLEGRCDVVLSGHRHVPHQKTHAGLEIFTSGSSTELGRYRMLTHEAGRLRDVRWAETTVKPAGRSTLAYVASPRPSSPALGAVLHS